MTTHNVSIKELSTLVAEKLELTHKAAEEAEEATRAVFEVITDSLVEGKEVSVPSFGKFTVTDTEARTGRNPQTGEALAIAASKRVGFKASSVLKRTVKA